MEKVNATKVGGRFYGKECLQRAFHAAEQIAADQ